jgi:Cu+-exporting ATPase
MALEPKGIPMTEGPSEEYIDFRRRFVLSSALGV